MPTCLTQAKEQTEGKLLALQYVLVPTALTQSCLSVLKLRKGAPSNTLNMSSWRFAVLCNRQRRDSKAKNWGLVSLSFLLFPSPFLSTTPELEQRAE